MSIITVIVMVTCSSLGLVFVFGKVIEKTIEYCQFRWGYCSCFKRCNNNICFCKCCCNNNQKETKNQVELQIKES